MRKFAYTFIFFFVLFSGVAQLKINLPLSRSVYQRDNKNTSTIYISGIYENLLDKIEGRLVALKAGQGITTDWVVIAENPDGGFFTGSINGSGGWYKLEIRGIKDNRVIMQDFVDRVGIGEVFVIAGQSNAEGKLEYGQKSATDDRVNCFDYRKEDFLDEIPPYNNFSHLTSNVSIAPRGIGAWCWGELGDYLVKRLNVPVLFFNAAYEGTSIENWYSSSIGVPTTHSFYKFTFPKNTPYSNLRVTLQYYISQLGIRAILWTQGENDSNTPEDYYATSLRKIIDKTRIDTGKKINWFVSRTSRTSDKVFDNVINAQNRVINVPESIFGGPFTDYIQPDRWDGTHIKNLPNNAGLSALAYDWAEVLSDDFFKTSSSFPPAETLLLTESCSKSSDRVTLNLKNTLDYSLVRWSNSSTQPTLDVSTGIYNAVAKDKFGNYFLSNSVDVAKVFPKARPIIYSKTSPFICPEGSVELVADTEYSKVKWSNGETTRQIIVKKEDTFTVQGFNDFGCNSPISNQIQTKYISSPQKPIINLLSSPFACEGSAISVSTFPQSKYLWSTKDTTQKISITKVGTHDISLQIRDVNGCISPPSDVLRVSVQPKPSTPSIQKVGTYTLAATTTGIKPDYFEWKKDDAYLVGSDSTIKTLRQGVYSVLSAKNYNFSTQQFTCKSAMSGFFSYIPESSANPIIIYPVPSNDGILYVESPQDFNDLYLNVFTMAGAKVYETTIQPLSQRQMLNLSKLPSGKYEVRVFNSLYTFDQTRQIIIEKN